MLTEPYAGYHGIVFDEQFGPAAFIMRARTEGLRDFGACLSPTNAFQLLQGVETLGVRMDRHMSNTHAVLEFLGANKAVDWVLHPALENHPDYRLAKHCCRSGAGSIISFGIKGGRRRRQEIHRSAAHDQPSRQCRRRQDAGHSSRPAPPISRWMPSSSRPPGIGEELVRLSVGIEAAADIIDDLGQALRVSQKA